MIDKLILTEEDAVVGDVTVNRMIELSNERSADSRFSGILLVMFTEEEWDSYKNDKDPSYYDDLSLQIPCTEIRSDRTSIFYQPNGMLNYLRNGEEERNLTANKDAMLAQNEDINLSNHLVGGKSFLVSVTHDMQPTWDSWDDFTVFKILK